MTQNITENIDPQSTSGTALAAIIDANTASFLTAHSGVSRPSYIKAGMVWMDTSSTTREINMFDGSRDVLIFRVNSSNGTIMFPYDNSGSGLASTDFQGAIDEIAAGGGGGGPGGGLGPAQAVTLTSGQVNVQFPSELDTLTLITVEGDLVDAATLMYNVDYTINTSTQITLTQSYPAGTRCVKR